MSVSVSLSVTVFVVNVRSFHTPAIDNGRKAVCVLPQLSFLCNILLFRVSVGESLAFP